tara:strand:- start:377098 stop:377946 length:849 start_codon:yes stop_codon:yes gene_type:complete
MMHVNFSRGSILRAVAVAAITLTVSAAAPSRADAQNEVLAEMYGRGVHAYYSGNYNDAYNMLSMAINNGSQDPRAYYFRGIVAEAQGRAYEAESDWQRGAELEAAGGQNPWVGRALARFQGSSRLKLEEIRQKARLQAMAIAAARSQARYGEIDAAQPAPTMQPAPTGATPPSAVTPPPVPDMGNPFDGDQGGVVAGEPKVESDDALEGAMDPFAEGAAPATGSAPAAAADDPFATPADAGAAPAEDPFASPDAGDPFAPAGDDGGAMADPFGGDSEDPFAN